VVSRVRLTSEGKKIKYALTKLYKEGLGGKVYSYILCRLNTYKSEFIVTRLTYRERCSII
jgi:hypothetical protein